MDNRAIEAAIVAVIAVVVFNVGKVIIEKTREKDGKAKKK